MKFAQFVGWIVLAVASVAASAADGTSSETARGQAAMLRVDHAWVRKLPAPLPNGGYAVLRNTGDKPAMLVGVESEHYGHAMLHRSDDSSGVSTMHHVESLRIPAHGEVVLKPGGYHLMLMHPTGELAVGQDVMLVLRFEDGSTLDVSFAVRDATGAKESAK